jgi:hypothetical protein
VAVAVWPAVDDAGAPPDGPVVGEPAFGLGKPVIAGPGVRLDVRFAATATTIEATITAPATRRRRRRVDPRLGRTSGAEPGELNEASSYQGTGDGPAERTRRPPEPAYPA